MEKNYDYIFIKLINTYGEHKKYKNVKIKLVEDMWRK